jgi:phosphate transport system substrate-binding protein
MNDEFLHRIRKTPPTEFLSELKSRLDRQSPAPPPRRRWSFTRGLITGLMLGGAAFALTAASLTRGPESLRSLVRTPVQYLARLMGGSGQGAGQDEARDKRHAVPLGPVWLPEHAAGRSDHDPRVPAQSTPFAVKQDGGGSASVNSAAPGSGAAGAARGGAFPPNYTIRVMTSPDAYPVATISAQAVARDGFRMISELDTGDGLDRLCNSEAAAPIEMVFLSRRMTAEEFRRCARDGTRLIEIKAGYQAIALARARPHGPLPLTARDLFLALARRIPDPAHPEKLISNPNTTWNQVDGALPADRILVAGSDPGSPSGKVMAHLLLRPGCNTYPWIAALRDSDPDSYEEICGSLRNDGSYVYGYPGGWSSSNMLMNNPTAVGIFSLSGLGLRELRRSGDHLPLNPVNSIEPGQAGLTAETYPLGEPLYLYVNKSQVFFSHAYMSVVNDILAPKNMLGTESDVWTFVPLEGTERQVALANAAAQKELQF